MNDLGTLSLPRSFTRNPARGEKSPTGQAVSGSFRVISFIAVPRKAWRT
jgi:hypothetical protein